MKRPKLHEVTISLAIICIIAMSVYYHTVVKPGMCEEDGGVWRHFGGYCSFKEVRE